METAVTVLVVHDRPLLFEGMRAVIEAEGWSAVSAEGDLARLLAGYSRESRALPDVCLLDHSAETVDPIAAIETLRSSFTDIPIVALFNRTSVTILKAAAVCGIRSFLSEHAPAEQLLQALLAGSAGQCFLCPRATREVLELLTAAPTEMLHCPDPRYEQLSCREREVFRLAATGLSNKEIAYHLGISPKTVATHHTRVCRKLGICDPVQLYRYAVRLGIIVEDYPGSLGTP